jgi:hypothetical protein
VSRPIAALSGEYLDPKVFRVSHSQKEAGIDHLEWEKRTRPLRSWSSGVLAPTIVTFTIVAALLFALSQVKV